MSTINTVVKACNDQTYLNSAGAFDRVLITTMLCTRCYGMIGDSKNIYDAGETPYDVLGFSAQVAVFLILTYCSARLINESST